MKYKKTAILAMLLATMVPAGILFGTKSTSATESILEPEAMTLDSSFDGDGIALYPSGTAWFDVGVLSTGKIVAAGSAGLVRFNADGSLDQVLPFSGGGSAVSMIVGADDSIIVVSSTGQVRRLDPAGVEDPAFSANVGGSARLAPAPEGKIVAVTSTEVIRLNANGSFDKTFDGDGRLFLDGAGPRSVTVQTDGKIIVGRNENGICTLNDGKFFLYRRNVDGSPDTSFDGDGTAVIIHGGCGGASAQPTMNLALFPDGRIVIGATVIAASVTGAAIAVVVSPNGSVDPTFGCAGFARFEPLAHSPTVGDAVVRDGRIYVVAGTHMPLATTIGTFVIWRIGPNGATEDFTETDVGDGSDSTMKAVFQPDGRLLVAGSAGYLTPEHTEALMIRYLAVTPGGTTPVDCGPSPTPTPPPASFVVTNTNDSDSGSLRQAVLDANIAPGMDTITFGPLFDSPQTITLTSGDIVFDNSVSASVTIEGPSANLLTVNGNNASRIFTILQAPTVVIKNMTLTNGNATSAILDRVGGAISNQGTLTLDGVVVTGNGASASGGGLYNGSGASITVNGCTVSNNISNSANSQNLNSGNGGGIYSAGTSLTISDSSITGNTAQALNFGGGINSDGTITITDTSMDGNSSVGGGGIFIRSFATASISRSTISGNMAPGGGGGGISTDTNLSGLTITNSTINGNSATNGGGINRATGATPSITASTISGNTATGNGGGMTSTAANINNTIIANNTAGGSGPDYSGTFNSDGFNLIQSTAGATINGTTVSNITGVDPNLGPLADNGGPTFTRALLPGSPAIDAGNTTLLDDQRLRLRPYDDPSVANAPGGNSSDIGAFERQPASTPTPTATPTPSGTPSTLYDFDGDGRSDLSVFRPMPDPADNYWYINRSSDGQSYQYEWGIETDHLAAADYDGDGKADLAVWREEPGDPDKANFYIYQSSDNAFRIEQFGRTGDVNSVVGDWDGDGQADPAVYRDDAGGGQSVFYYQPSSQPGVDFTAINWGTTGDRPVRGDFDGDGTLDAAVFRPSDSIWYIRESSTGQPRYDKWGSAGDRLVPADYDGDGKTDMSQFSVTASGTFCKAQTELHAMRCSGFRLTYWSRQITMATVRPTSPYIAMAYGISIRAPVDSLPLTLGFRPTNRSRILGTDAIHQVRIQ